jgi:tryptophanyl-tRNA synthetase
MRIDSFGGSMSVALTGIKPSGSVHLGNYLGMIRPAIAFQEKVDPYYFIADYHAMTQASDGEALHRETLELTATFVALGLDLSRAALFRQSAVAEVCELAWVLGCVMPIGQLERGHAVKAAKSAGRDVNVATMYYPVLMAADILLYDADIVPVGKDQLQHVEVARDLATKVNHLFGEGTLIVPEVSVREDVGAIPGLDGRKMSKSYGNQIPLWAPPKRLRKLIMKIKTDSLDVAAKKDPVSCNVFQLYKLFASEEQIAALAARYQAGGMGYGEAKQALFESVDAELKGPRERYEALMADPAQLEEILAAGAVRANAMAQRTIKRVRDRVGLSPRIYGNMR